jgi:hypothetical protein
LGGNWFSDMEGVDVLAIQMKAHRVRVGDHRQPGALVRGEKPVEIAAGEPISQWVMVIVGSCIRITTAAYNLL